MKLSQTIRILTLVSLLLSLTFSTQPVLAADERAVTPDSDLQAVIDAANPGDTIRLSPGIYYQSATINKPLTLKAETGGSVALTGMHKGRFEWKQDGNTPGLWSAAVPWKILWVMDGERTLLNYETLEHLLAFTFRTTDKPGPQEGFVYDLDAQKLWVRLHNGANPNERPPAVNRDGGGYGLTIDADDVTISGLRLIGWRRAAIQILAPHHNITVSDNSFEGNQIGIITDSWGPEHTGFLIERNHFSTYPVYEYRKAGNYATWSGLYSSNLGTIGIHAYTNGMTVRNNYFNQLFDAVQILGWKYYDEMPPVVSDVSYNVIHSIVDNPLEFDPIKVSVNVRAHHNFIFDAHAMVSLTSFQFGKAVIDHNIFFSTPEEGVATYWFKSKLNPQADQSLPVRNLTLVHNTVVLLPGGDLDSVLYTPGSEEASYQNCRIENNIVLVKHVSNSRQYDLTRGEGLRFTNANLLDGPGVDAEVLAGSLHQDPAFRPSSPQMDFRLSKNSPAIGRGVNQDNSYFHTSQGGTDLGAIESGSEWQMPRPGPAWGMELPALPASINPVYLGFGPGASVPVTPPPDISGSPIPPEPSPTPPQPDNPAPLPYPPPFQIFLPMVR